MSSGLVSVIKEIAMDAVDNSKMPDLRFGTVISESPLKVRVTNQFIIPSSMLIVPQHLTDYEVDVTIASSYGWKTQDRSGGAGEAAYSAHNHDIVIGEQTMKIHNRLKTGDKVALLRKQGGQSYFVLDRLVE
jgi:hypothetical protein